MLGIIRTFIGVLALIAGHAFADLQRLPIVQGPTSESETQIALLTEIGDELEVFVSLDGTKYFSEDVIEQRVPHTESKVVTAQFRGLPLASQWQLTVLRKGEVVDSRSLKSLDPESQSLRFALVSCSKDKHQYLYPEIWRELLDQNPDFILYLGDTVYIDSWRARLFGIKEKTISKRHVEARTRFNLFYQPDLVPIYAIWDDHDYGTNNGNHKFKRKEFSLKVFKMFFPQNTVNGFETGPGVSKSIKVGNQKFVLLDNRYFRDEKMKRKTYLGAEQWEWLQQQVKGDESMIWLGGGSQFFGGYRSTFGESYEGDYEEEFEILINDLSQLNKRVAFLSGDIHATELMSIESELLGYETFEFTSSGIIRKDFEPDYWKRRKNPRQLYGFSEGPNYGIVESILDESEALKIDIKALTSGRSQVYSQQYEWSLDITEKNTER